MATDSDAALPQFDRPFRLCAIGARVLAQNIAGKVIDIGEMDCSTGNACSIRLDVDAIETGPQPNPEQALRVLVPMLGFDYLDGLFTSEGEARFSSATRRSAARRVHARRNRAARTRRPQAARVVLGERAPARRTKP